MLAKFSGLKAIALLEAFKGCLALGVATGLHVLAGQNIQTFVERIVSHLHLNPASHYPHILINAASQVSDKNVNLVAGGVVLYTLIRFVEAYGLWHKKRWVEWFALLSGAIYIPFELVELFKRFNLLTVSILLLNIVVVCYLFFVMFKSQPSSTHNSALH